MASAFGIEAFITEGPPFSVTFKREVEDFQVVEVGLDGEEAALTDTTSLPEAPALDPEETSAPRQPPQPPPPGRGRGWAATAGPADLAALLGPERLAALQRFAEEGEGLAAEAALDLGAMNNKADRAALFAGIKQRWPFLTTKAVAGDEQCAVLIQADRHYARLRQLLSADDTWLLVQFACECLEDLPKAVTLSAAGADKAARTAIHQAIAACYPFLKTRTVECLGKQSITVYTSPNANRDRKRKLAEATEKGQRWVRFVLRKRNVETMDAVARLASFCNTHPSSFSFAGIKDKRGITTQFFTACATAVKPKRLLAVNSAGLPLEVGDLRYVPQPLSNGQLLGNRFVVTLRDVTAPVPEVEAAIRSAADRGFVNYYGPQRFGDERYDVQTFMVGKAMLQQQWREAVELLLRPDAQSTEDVRRAKEHWTATRDAQATLKLMPQYRQTEVLVLKSLHRYATLPNVYEKALLNIPHTMRTMMLHSYCSFVWNMAATTRIQRHGLAVVAGDLVALQPAATADESEGVAGDPERVPPHVVTAEEAAEGRYRIDQVVLPMPGKHTVYPENDTGDMYRQLLARDGVSPAMLAQKVLQVALPGAYRPLLARPRDLQFEWTADSVAGDAATSGSSDPGATLPDTSSAPHQLLRLRFFLPRASYATLLLREICKTAVVPAHSPTGPDGGPPGDLLEPEPSPRPSETDPVSL